MHDNSTDIYSIYNEGKSVVTEKFIRSLKNKIFKHMTTVSENVYIKKLDKTVCKYNNSVMDNDNDKLGTKVNALVTKMPSTPVLVTKIQNDLGKQFLDHLHQWSIFFSIKNLETLLLTQEQKPFLRINNWLMNDLEPSLEAFSNAIFDKFEVLILQTYN